MTGTHTPALHKSISPITPDINPAGKILYTALIPRIKGQSAWDIAKNIAGRNDHREFWEDDHSHETHAQLKGLTQDNEQSTQEVQRISPDTLQPAIEFQQEQKSTLPWSTLTKLNGLMKLWWTENRMRDRYERRKRRSNLERSRG